MRRKAEGMVNTTVGQLYIREISRRRSPGGRMYAMALCACSCGVTKWIRVENIRAKYGSKSCGCLQRTATAARNRIHGDSPRGKVTKEYRTWSMMLNRCRNPNAKSFKDYGGKGVTVCERWETFANFLTDMGRAPGPHYTIERRNVTVGYEPVNCYWLPRRLQGKNTSRVRRITYKGQTKILTDWALHFEVAPSVLHRLIGKHGETEALVLLETLGFEHVP